MKETIEQLFNQHIYRLQQQFGRPIDLEGVLFLIGVQELGKGLQKFNKDQKMDLLHIGICKLLSQYGYYQYTHTDADGWPHYVATNKKMTAYEKETLLKQAIVDYFDKAI